MPSASTNPVLTVVRPAGVAVLLLAAVAATAAVLYAYWPAGIAVGVVLGTVAVVAIGARMQLTDRMQPVDAELTEMLGMTAVRRAPVAIAPEAETETESAAAFAPPTAVARPVEGVRPAESARPAEAPAAVETPVEREPVLHVQPDVLYFTSDDDPDHVEVREVVTAANDIIAVPDQEPAVVEAGPDEVVPDETVRIETATGETATDGTEVDASEASADEAAPVEDEAAPVEQEEVAAADLVREDLERLKVDLGDDYRDFARAARLVVSTQYASAARLQRDLDLPYSRARRLLLDLEQQHFVGPATGSLPRQVLLPKDRLPEVEALLADA